MDYVIGKMQPRKLGEEMALEVRNATYDMFNDYKRKMSSLSGQASDKAQSLTAEEVEQIGESFTDVYISGFKKSKSAVQDENAKTELDKYLSEGIEEDKEGFDLLGW